MAELPPQTTLIWLGLVLHITHSEKSSSIKVVIKSQMHRKFLILSKSTGSHVTHIALKSILKHLDISAGSSRAARMLGSSLASRASSKMGRVCVGSLFSSQKFFFWDFGVA